MSIYQFVGCKYQLSLVKGEALIFARCQSISAHIFINYFPFLNKFYMFLSYSNLRQVISSLLFKDGTIDFGFGSPFVFF